MTSTEFVKKVRDAAENYKTVYVQGAFGAPMVTTPWDNIKRYTVDTTNSYNLKHASEIQAVADDGYFGFDCVCFIKGILWGWSGNADARYGGAEYCSNGVPDIGTSQIITVCSDVSEDFSHVKAGELLHKSGHVGIYIGDGLAVECTPSWDGGVQITAVGNIGKVAGYNTRTWTKHGKLPYVEYAASSSTEEIKMIDVSVPVVKKGVKIESVKAVQALLNMRIDAGLDVDGSCGGKTDAAIRAFQNQYGLDVDGSCGKKTWSALLNG